MMQSTWHLLLLLAHASILAGLFCSEGSWPQWLAVPLTFLSAVLFAFAAIYASSLQIATDSGIESTSEPAIGIYAFGLATIAFILAIVMALNWLPRPKIRGGSHGY